MRFLGLDWQIELDRARASLAAFVHAPADRLVFVPSSTTGIAIALHSARLAAQGHANGGTAAAYQARLAQDVAAQVRRATHLSRALVHPAAQTAAVVAAQLVPALMAGIARATRIPSRSLERARRALVPM